MNISEADLKKSFETKIIPVDTIFSDDTEDDKFNCRDAFTYADVQTLAESISATGLQNPICVQPASDVAKYKKKMPDGYDWRTLSGHRRLKAFRLLKATHIPAMVKVGLTEEEAAIFNLIENIERKELNILEEAKSIQRLYEMGMGRERTAKRLNKTASWVQTRFSLLEMPEEIQLAAATGLINQYQIKELYTHRSNPEDLFAAFRQIKDAKLRGEKAPSVSKVKLNVLKTGNNRSKRTYPEMMALMSHLQGVQGNSILTRLLAWATGNISDAELHADLTEWSQKEGLNYELPPYELEPQVPAGVPPQIAEVLAR